MRKQIITLALASGLGLGAAAIAVPGIASAADSAGGTATSGLADRISRLKQALAGLVTDGTISQAQADKVASTLAAQAPPYDGRGHGPGGGKLSPEAVAKALGITVDQLRTAQESGQTLAQIAAANGISKADLISKLVAAAKAELAAAVKAGGLTQAQADAMSTDLTARITEKVDQVGPPRGRHEGPAPAAPSTSSSTTATPSSTA